MPGICGWIEIGERGPGQHPEDGDLLDRMVEELGRSSGQQSLLRVDDGPIHVAAVGRASSGHRPLVEPSAAGQRQLWYGEIHSGSMAGPLDAVRGCFAGMRWDARDGGFELFTDRLSAIPLCYRRVGPWLLFAPEVKALLVCEPQELRADAGSLALFLAAGYLPPERTHFEQVRRLPPAGRLSGRSSAAGAAAPLRSSRYWRYTIHERNEDRGEPAHARELTACLRETIARQVFSGERVGVCLSGGVDSRTVLGLVLEAGARVEAVTWGFALGRPDSDVDIARRLAAIAGVRHCVVELDPAALPRHAADWVWQTDGSIDGLYNYPQGLQVFHEIARDQDVLFRGEQSFMRWPFGVPDDDTAKAAMSLRRLRWHGFWSDVLRPDAWAALDAADGAVHEEIAAGLLASTPADRKDEYFYAVHHYCKMNLLNYFKMLALPVRNPFLDPAVLDLYRSLPRKYRQGKHLFHAAMRPVTERFAHIPWATHTNLIPWGRLLGQQPALASYVRDTLLDARPELSVLVDRGRLENELRSWLTPRPPATASAKRWAWPRTLAKRMVYSSVTPRALRHRVLPGRDGRRRMPYLFRLLVLAHYAELLHRRGIRLDWSAVRAPCAGGPPG